MREIDGCGQEMSAALDCFARQPLAHWECNDDGDAAIKDGFCNDPQQRVADCLQKSAAARGQATPRSL